MKKRLLSLLLAVAMMLAVVPTAAFAGDEAGTASSKTLSITADGKPDVTGIVPTKDSSNHDVYVGDGWRYVYTSETYSSLSLGVDNDGDSLNGEPIAFKFNNPTSSSCVVNIYNASLSDSTVNATVRVYSPDVTVTNCVFNSNLHIMSSVSAPAVVKNCIFTNPSYAISGSHTLDGWNIFANNPGTTNNKYAIHVTNGGRITKLKVGNTEVAMNTADLYVVGKHEIDDDLKLTLDDGTVRTILKSEIANGASTDLPKHIPLTIKEDGTPDTSKMTLNGAGDYVSDDWRYDPSAQTLSLHSDFNGAAGPYPVKLKVDNAGTITDGIFTEAVSGNGKITGGVFLQKPSNTDVYTIAAGEDRILTELTLGDKTVALDANTTALYVVGTPSSDLTVTVKNAYSNTYNFVIPAGSLISNLTLDNLLHIGTKELKFGADGIPNTSGTYCYYHPSTPEDKTYFGANWRYFSKSNMLYLDADNFDLGSTLITVNVNGSLTGGIIAKGATLYTLGTVKNVVVYGTLLTSSQAHIENCILLNPPEYRIGRSPSIQDCIIVNNPGNWRKTAITATDGAKITTIQLGDLTMTLDEPVSEI